MENKPTLLRYDDANKVAYAYDNLGRTKTRTVTVGGTACAASYEYAAGGQTHDTDASKISTTELIKKITQPGGNFTYTYDDNGNITSVVQDGVTTSYAYDALGQLTRVDDGQENATWVYTYDQGGNILSKKKYALGVTTGNAIESKAFTYGNSNWKDQLTAVNGVGITYDNIGNPTYDGTWSYTWEKGRQLKSMSKSGTTASFKYNENGLRVQKTVNGVVTNYTLHGKNIMHMTQGSHKLHFFYDAQHMPAIVEYNGTKYAYVRNLQGDIVSILDSTGSVVVYYKYDAWGRPISKAGSMAGTLGTVQPFRYRGYVYDEETELYYVASRFYSPALDRWINADDAAYLGASGSILSYNLFTYCDNNPVIGYDPTGHFSWANVFKIAAVVTAAAIAVAVIVGSGGSAAAPLLAAVSALTGTTASAAAVTTVATGVAATGIAVMSGAATGMILEARTQGKDYQQARGNKQANQWAQQLGFDGAEAFKEAMDVGKGSRFNMFLDRATGEIILISIQGAIEIATGYFLK